MAFVHYPVSQILQMCYNTATTTGKNTAQTDEEKQRERQRNEREQKNAEIEAQHIKVMPVISCT